LKKLRKSTLELPFGGVLPKGYYMETQEWHLSKSIPATFVLAIIGQTVALVWFVSALNSDIENNSRDIVRHEIRLIALENIVQSQAVTMGRMDENIKAIRIAIEKMSNRD
tara:strand:- start:1389 stop:1718 length:330 start_codon:yes stop_codon:yes gene_type:complete